MSEQRKVVVGIDGSDVAHEALKFAAGEAERRGARLTIVHAGEVPVPGFSEEAAAAIRQEVHTFANVLCTEAVATVAGHSPTVETEVLLRDGDAAEILIEASAQAELLVVGTHRMGRLRGFVLGSVSQRVAANAKCPVATISGPPTDDRSHVVVGVSASAGGQAALRFACVEARLRGLPLRAVRALTVENWTMVGMGYPVAMDATTLEQSAKLELMSALELASTEFPDVKVDGVVATGDAYTALFKATGDAALLVIGSRRPRDATLPHLGPVAAWLLHQAQCPLVVVGFDAQQSQAEVPAHAGQVASPA